VIEGGGEDFVCIDPAAFITEAADLEAVGRRGGFKMEIGAVEGVSVLKPTELSFPPKTALISQRNTLAD
jgi:hypothetical protein